LSNQSLRLTPYKQLLHGFQFYFRISHPAKATICLFHGKDVLPKNLDLLEPSWVDVSLQEEKTYLATNCFVS